MKCLNCKSKSIIKYGYSREKQRYICNRCQKTFTEYSYRNFPPTSVHPLFIALIIHRYSNEPLDKLTKRVNNLLQLFKSKRVSIGSKTKVSRSTVYKWLNHYEAFADNISTKQTGLFFQGLIKQAFPGSINKEPPEQDIIWEEMEVTIKGFKSYIEFLKHLQKNLDVIFFNAIIKHQVTFKLYKQKKQRTEKYEYSRYKWSKKNSDDKL